MRCNDTAKSNSLVKHDKKTLQTNGRTSKSVWLNHTSIIGSNGNMRRSFIESKQSQAFVSFVFIISKNTLVSLPTGNGQSIIYGLIKLNHVLCERKWYDVILNIIT